MRPIWIFLLATEWTFTEQAFADQAIDDIALNCVSSWINPLLQPKNIAPKKKLAQPPPLPLIVDPNIKNPPVDTFTHTTDTDLDLSHSDNAQHAYLESARGRGQRVSLMDETGRVMKGQIVFIEQDENNDPVVTMDQGGTRVRFRLESDKQQATVSFPEEIPESQRAVIKALRDLQTEKASAELQKASLGVKILGYQLTPKGELGVLTQKPVANPAKTETPPKPQLSRIPNNLQKLQVLFTELAKPTQKPAVPEFQQLEVDSRGSLKGLVEQIILLQSRIIALSIRTESGEIFQEPPASVAVILPWLLQRELSATAAPLLASEKEEFPHQDPSTPSTPMISRQDPSPHSGDVFVSLQKMRSTSATTNGGSDQTSMPPDQKKTQLPLLPAVQFGRAPLQTDSEHFQKPLPEKPFKRKKSLFKKQNNFTEKEDHDVRTLLRISMNYAIPVEILDPPLKGLGASPLVKKFTGVVKGFLFDDDGEEIVAIASDPHERVLSVIIRRIDPKKIRLTSEAPPEAFLGLHSESTDEDQIEPRGTPNDAATQ